MNCFRKNRLDRVIKLEVTIILLSGVGTLVWRRLNESGAGGINVGYLAHAFENLSK